MQGSVYVWTMAPPEAEADAPLCIDEWYGIRAADAGAPLGVPAGGTNISFCFKILPSPGINTRAL